MRIVVTEKAKTTPAPILYRDPSLAGPIPLAPLQVDDLGHRRGADPRLPSCPYCRARVGQHCKTKGIGSMRPPHKARLAQWPR